MRVALDKSVCIMDKCIRIIILLHKFHCYKEGFFTRGLRFTLEFRIILLILLVCMDTDVHNSVKWASFVIIAIIMRSV